MAGGGLPASGEHQPAAGFPFEWRCVRRPDAARDTDTAALAVYHGELSDDLEDTGSETVVELNYTFWATPWLGITPDFQYVFNPGGGSSDDDAAVFGGQIMVNFSPAGGRRTWC